MIQRLSDDVIEKIAAGEVLVFLVFLWFLTFLGDTESF